jgi:dipeptidyl aminopeptidase/acylaminoacyl peptidase
VPAEQSRRFFAALQAAHVEASLHVIDNLGAFGSAWDAAVSHAEVDAFLDAHLKGTLSKHRGVSH